LRLECVDTQPVHGTRFHCRGDEPFDIIGLRLARDVRARAPDMPDARPALTAMTRLTPEKTERRETR
jgi:hypothetical protein